MKTEDKKAARLKTRRETFTTFQLKKTLLAQLKALAEKEGRNQTDQLKYILNFYENHTAT